MVRIKDEYDIANLFHPLLKFYFDNSRTEEWSPSDNSSL